MTGHLKPVAIAGNEHPVTAAVQALSPKDDLDLRLVSPPEEARWNRLIRQHHYLKEHRLVGESLRYVATRRGRWIALLGWSSAAFHLRARDAWIGWTEQQRHARRHLLACNARFLILRPKARTPNLASRLLSRNLHRLSQDWFDHYAHPILLAETFVDPERFEGTCYRAANWIELGLTKGFARSRLDFYQLHAHPKALFLYPLSAHSREQLRAPVLPPALAAHERTPAPQHYPLSRQQTHSLLQAFAKLPDPRRRRGWRHRNTASVLAIVVAALIAGNNTLLDIGDFAQSLSQRHLRSLRATRCRRAKRYLAPSETTLRRLLQRLDPEALDRITGDWLHAHYRTLGISALAVDGKALRTAAKSNGQPLQLFAALDLQARTVCRQVQIPAKTNEIPALKDLLADLNLRGTLVTLDALHTQKESARYLVEDKRADYLLPVKANQPALFRTLSRLARTNAFFPSGPHPQPGSRPT